VRLYLDEDVYQGVLVGLRRRGFDVLSTVEAGLRGASDEEQLHFAIAEDRSLFTFNRGDFVRLHSEVLARGDHHPGILVCSQVPVGLAVRLLAGALAPGNLSRIRDQLIWLRRRS